jgi:phosphoribosyl 1,2-cyclic phosphate phosphodiesterase
VKITFLGTGASHGIPVIGCNCNTCKSTNSKDKRLRSSVFIETKNNNIVIDTCPDFRQQMLRENILKIDAVLLTHEHKDHTAGLDDVRAYNYLMKKQMSIYAENHVLETIKREYAYAFIDNKYPGAPEMNLFPIENEPFFINNDKIIPIRGYHNKLPVFGFRINKFAYLTDTKIIPEREKNKLTGLHVLVISALRIKTHIAHMGLDEVLAVIKELKPQRAYLTHISHMQYSYNELLNILPENIYPAYDGLKINI